MVPNPEFTPRNTTTGVFEFWRLAGPKETRSGNFYSLFHSPVVCDDETHSTREGRLATFLLFLIFGTAERTPFAQKSYVRKSTSGIILHLLRVEFCNSQEVQNYSTNLTVFALRKDPTGLFGGNRAFFTNKEAYWATSIGSNGPFDSKFSGRFDSNFRNL